MTWINEIIIKHSYQLILIVFIGLFASCKHELPVNLKVDNLRCEMLTNPEGIDVFNPRLSWEIEGKQRTIKQTAYQIIVASSVEKLKYDSGDLLNYGMISFKNKGSVNY